MISFHLPSLAELIKCILIVYYCGHEDGKEILKVDSCHLTNAEYTFC